MDMRNSRHQGSSLYTTPRRQDPYVPFVMPKNKDLVSDLYQESSIEMLGFVSPPLPFLPSLDEPESSTSTLDHKKGVMLAMKASNSTFSNVYKHSIRSKHDVSKGIATPTKRKEFILGLSLKTAKAAWENGNIHSYWSSQFWNCCFTSYLLNPLDFFGQCFDLSDKTSTLNIYFLRP